MTQPIPEFTQEELRKQVEEASGHVEDLLYGRKTLGQIVRISESEVEATFQKAQNALKLEDYKNAALMFQAVLVVNNQDMRALLGLAGALEGQKEYFTAVMAYMVVMAANFQDPVAPLRAGICFMQMGKKEEAVKLFALARDCDEKRCSPGKRKYIQKAKSILQAVS